MNERTVVVNKQHSKYDVDISRDGGSLFGNYVGRGMKREVAIAAFERTMEERLNDPVDGHFWRNELEKLRGKRLGCYCRPRPCHGDVLVRLLNAPRSNVR